MSIRCLKLLPITSMIYSKILDTIAKVTTFPLTVTHTDYLTGLLSVPSYHHTRASFDHGFLA